FYYYVYVNNNLSLSYDSQVTVEYGGDVTLTVTVTADDTEGLTYFWEGYDYTDYIWTEYAEDTNTLTLTNVQSNGTYECRVTDKYGNYQWAWFYVSIDSGLMATGDTWNSYTVDYGESQILSADVAVNEGVGLTYQWYQEILDEDGYYSYTLELDEESSNYTIEAVDSYGYYWCVVSDPYGNTLYFYYYVYVNSGLTSGDYTSSYFVEYGGSQELATNASANTGIDLTYQWYQDGNKIEGATSATYIVTDVTSYGFYYCRVSDPYGSSIDFYYYIYVVDFSNAIVMTEGVASVANIQTAGEMAYFSFTPSAGGIYNFYSQEDGEDTYGYLFDSSYNLLTSNDDGGDNLNFRISYTLTAGETYYLVARYYSSDTTGTFSVYVYGDSGLAADGDTWYSYTVEYGESQTLTASATANDGVELTYQWYESWNEIEGATTSTYTIDSVEAYGYYQCRVSDPYGSYIYFYYNVHVNNNLSLSYDSQVAVEYGGDVTLTVTVTANDTEGLTYYWQVYDYTDYTWTEYESTTGTLTLTDVQGKKECDCRVTDKYGNYQWAWFYVSINSGLEVGEYTSEYHVSAGESLTLTTNAVVNEGVDLTYQWYEEVENEEEGYSYWYLTEIDGATESTYNTGAVDSDKYYQCRVFDSYGNTIYFYYSVYVDEDVDYTLGDVNGDGKINTRDIILVSQYLAGLAELSVEKAADVNVDGRINTRDLILISQYVAGLITSF
ncbi:MAG: dockerin type I domain-containing protein, partial [Oscillospiraceae bacterium]|nr:dockerin type I domain-containing protein [Oscillospiraceae bacterium]